MTAHRLNKTERELLAEAARKPHGTLYAMTWWSTTAKRHNNGMRAVKALKSLVEKGLADGYHAEHNFSPNVDQFGTTFAVEYGAKITAAGRAALTLETDQ
jgi:hypothetical protein